jgi:hypothetical protein
MYDHGVILNSNVRIGACSGIGSKPQSISKQNENTYSPILPPITLQIRNYYPLSSGLQKSEAVNRVTQTEGFAGRRTR